MTLETVSQKSNLVYYPANRAVVLRNIRCVYRGGALTQCNTTQDHVIGRRLVPKGKFNAQWNLILNACRTCNSRKSDLEDDISAITLLPDATGRFPHNDAAVIADARRRASKSISRRTRKSVQSSNERMKIEGSLGPDVGVIIDFVGPPQIDEQRGFELARLHLTALFFMQTYDHETREGGWWLHGFHPVKMTRREDWGNPTMRAFMAAIGEWDCRLHAVTADGFFKTVTRRHPLGECWAWAVEWNHSHRLIGFFGQRKPAQEIVDGFPRPKLHTIFEAPNRFLRYSMETPLPEGDDTLFIPPPSDDDVTGDTFGAIG